MENFALNENPFATLNFNYNFFSFVNGLKLSAITYCHQHGLILRLGCFLCTDLWFTQIQFLMSFLWSNQNKFKFKRWSSKNLNVTMNMNKSSMFNTFVACRQCDKTFQHTDVNILMVVRVKKGAEFFSISLKIKYNFRESGWVVKGETMREKEPQKRKCEA